jgi:tyrosinase
MRDLLTLPAETFEGFMEFDEVPLLEEEVRRGSAEHTRWVQSSLNQVNGERLAVDGIFGPLTGAAVRRFQTKARITVDGIVGPQTEGALMAAGAPPVPGSTGSWLPPTTPGSWVPTPTPGSSLPSTTPAPATVVRKRSTGMTSTEQERFRSVIQRLVDEPGSPNRFGALVSDHAGSHRMHGSTANGLSVVGEQRFLPWHRVYLMRLEEMMRTVDPLAFIPYWDWTRERQVPPWMAELRPRIRVRGGISPGNVIRANRSRGFIPGTLGSDGEVNTILASTAYTPFTRTLERGPHDGIHGWVGGPMGVVRTASGDPLFWLHHANIDRLWARWQATHPGLDPLLSPGSSSTMDPWPETVSDVASISTLGYSYGP